jgi:hypothetical protein
MGMNTSGAEKPFGARSTLYTIGWLVFILGVVPSLFYVAGEWPTTSLSAGTILAQFWRQLGALLGLSIFSLGLAAYVFCSAWLIFFGRGPQGSKSSGHQPACNRGRTGHLLCIHRPCSFRWSAFHAQLLAGDEDRGAPVATPVRSVLRGVPQKRPALDPASAAGLTKRRPGRMMFSATAPNCHLPHDRPCHGRNRLPGKPPD